MRAQHIAFLVAGAVIAKGLLLLAGCFLT